MVNVRYCALAALASLKPQGGTYATIVEEEGGVGEEMDQGPTESIEEIMIKVCVYLYEEYGPT